MPTNCDSNCPPNGHSAACNQRYHRSSRDLLNRSPGQPDYVPETLVNGFSPIDEDEGIQIETLRGLIRAIAMGRFGGYDSFDVDFNQEHSGGGFLIVKVWCDNPHDQQVVEDYVGYRFFGEMWFDDDDRVRQVL